MSNKTAKSRIIITGLSYLLSMILAIGVGVATPITVMANEHDTSSITSGTESANSTGKGDKPSDVSIKNGLESDESSITSVKLTDVIDGTAPFDKDDKPGDDSSVSNGIVRSFDRVTFMVESTVTSDNPMVYYKNTRIGYRIRIPVGPNKAVFNYKAMGWVDTHNGYKPVISNDKDGGQTLTAYRLLTPTSETPTTTPGTYEVPFIIDVKAMTQGETLQPTIEVWSEPNTIKHRSMRLSLQPITVSSTPKYDVSLIQNRNEGYQNSGAPNWWDFSRSDHRDKPITSSDGMNKELGRQKGIMSYSRFGVNMRWSDESKGIKGLEVPKPGTTMSIRLEFSNTVTKNANEQLPAESKLQPWFWAADSHDGGHQGMHSRVSDNWSPNQWLAAYPGFYYNDTNTSKVYNGGNFTIKQTRENDKTIIDIDIKSWEVDPNKFPVGGANYGQCGTWYSFSDCTIKVAQVSQGAIYMFSPTEIDGASLQDHYNASVTLKQQVKATGMRIESATNQVVTSQEDPVSNGRPVDDNTYQGAFNLIPSGKFNMETWYACSAKPNSVWADFSTDCSGWRGATFNGMDRAPLDSMLMINLEDTFTTQNAWSLAPVFSINIAKIDDKLLEPTNDLRLSDSEHRDMDDTSGGEWDRRPSAKPVRPLVKYVTKPDGKGWESDTEQANAGVDDLRYWDGYDDAKAHGVIVGVAILSLESGRSTSSQFNPLRFQVHVKNDAKNIGKTGQLTQIAESWTRKDLLKHGVTPPGIAEDSSTETWNEWTKTIDPLELRKRGKPTYHTDSAGKYTKSRYDSDGNYIPGTEGMVYGDTVLITGETTTIGVSTEQISTDTGKIGKTIYDLDNGQRYIDWVLTPTTTTTVTKNKTTSQNITVTLPKGLSYVTGSSYLNGEYSERTPSQGAVSKYDRRPSPKVTVNADGSTTILYELENARADGTANTIRFSTFIGDPSDPDTDVKNGQQFVMKAMVSSPYDLSPATFYNRKIAQFTVQVSRTRGSSLATRAMTLINDTNAPLSFRNMVSNPSSTVKTNVCTVDILPWNTAFGSSYHGSITLQSLQLQKIGKFTGTITVYATNDPKYRTTETPDGTTTGKRGITTDEIMKQWTVLPVGTDGTVSLKPLTDNKATAFAIIINEMEPKSRVNVNWTMGTHDNMPSDVYSNRWSDLSNTVIALSSIADREVNGIVWFDVNEDGIRQQDEPRMDGVTVSVTGNDGKTIKRTDGSDAVTVTDRNGEYRITGVPSGGGYRLHFTESPSQPFHTLDTTIKHAGNASKSLDSDADPVKANERLTGAEIQLADFPVIEDMTSNRYVDSHEDTGLHMASFMQRSIPRTGKHESIILLALLSLVLISIILCSVTLMRNRGRD